MASGGVIGYVTLTGIIEEEDDQFVSYCRELGTSSCGDTIDEAFNNLGDAIEVHINGLIETGELIQVFRERNIRIDMPSPFDEASAYLTVPVGKTIKTYRREVPVLEPV